MKCKITRELYEELKHCIVTGKLKYIKFDPLPQLSYDITIEGRNKNQLLVNLKDRFAEFYYDNEFMWGATFYPKIEDNNLKFDVIFNIDISEYNSFQENWNFEKLIDFIKFDLINYIKSELIIDNLELDLQLRIDQRTIINDDYYLFNYKSTESSNYDVDLSNDSNIKDKVIRFVKDWALINFMPVYLQGSADSFVKLNENCGYSIRIENSELIEFRQYIYEEVLLKVI